MESPEASEHQHGPVKKHGGPSSFDMHDEDAVFAEIGLKPGDTLVDIGCGPGDYSLHAASLVSPGGLVHALDRWRDMIKRMDEQAVENDIANIRGHVCDVTAPLPLADGIADACLMATMLHIVDLPKFGKGLFDEVHRILKPHGKLCIINCKKEDQPWGPPKRMRLSPEECRDLVEPSGFVQTGYLDLGYNYLIRFEPQ